MVKSIRKRYSLVIFAGKNLTKIQVIMYKLSIALSALLCLLAVSYEGQAQLSTPAPSPFTELKTTVGLTDIAIEYSRPSVRGREIFAAGGLVPYGNIWRTGANAATRLTFSKDVSLGGKDLKAGSYALLTKPGAEEWEVMLFPYESGNWGSYVEKDPVATFTAEVGKAGHRFETFTIDVNDIRHDGANINLLWNYTLVSLPLNVHTDKQVKAAFEKMMAGPTAGEYYAMGNYLFESEQDLEKALEFVQKATAGDNPAFWQVHREALILGELGRYDEAVKAAEKSMEMAKAAGNMDYVRLNENAIEKWKNMK